MTDSGEEKASLTGLDEDDNANLHANLAATGENHNSWLSEEGEEHYCPNVTQLF